MLKIVPVLALISVAAASQAITFNFINVRSGNHTPNGQIATLDIVNFGANKVKFTLTSNWNPSVYGASAFISELEFNVRGTSLSAGTRLSGNTISGFGHGGTDAGLSFNNSVNFPTSNRGDRFLKTDTSSWTYTRTGLTASDFLAPMMIHLQNLGNYCGGDSSAKFTAVQASAPVPEPATMAVLGFGLVPFMRKRLKRA